MKFKDIKLVDFAVSDDLKQEGVHVWQECATKCVSDIVIDEDYVYVAEIDCSTNYEFTVLAGNLSRIFRSKGVDNIIFVPRGKISFKKIEVIHS